MGVELTGLTGHDGGKGSQGRHSEKTGFEGGS